MALYIPSKSRARDQITIKSIPEELLNSTFIVVPATQKLEYDRFNPGYNILTTPAEGIHAVRQWILEDARDAGFTSAVMLDDDLVFAKRRADNLSLFENVTIEDLRAMFSELSTMLSAYAHGSILAREGGNRITTHFKYTTRMLRILGYNVAKFFEAEADFTRMQLMEDFDVTLQLLRKGYDNVVLCDWVSNQKRSNAPGGCSTYRTPEMQSAAARRLAELHPGFVKVVTKSTKSAWGWGSREDVIIQWKKALESSK
jgi:hypothetical protein